MDEVKGLRESRAHRQDFHAYRHTGDQSLISFAQGDRPEIGFGLGEVAVGQEHGSGRAVHAEREGRQHPRREGRSKSHIEPKEDTCHGCGPGARDDSY